MITEVWDRTLGLLHKRFMANALLPVLLLIPMSVVTAAAGLGRLDDVAHAIQRVTFASFVLVSVGYLLGCWFLAAFVQSQWHNIVRLLEGYPLRAIPAAYRYGTAVHQRRLRVIQADQELQHLQHYRYPIDEADVMPTTLGNTLRAAERYPFDRYRADTIITWPRLAALVPASFAAQVDEFRAGMEFLAVVCVWCASFTALTGGALVLLGGSPSFFAVVLVVGSAATWAAYRGTVEAAEEYGDQLKVGHDLYRNLLFAQLRLPMPDTLERERAQWLALHDFIYANAVDQLSFVDGAPSQQRST